MSTLPRQTDVCLPRLSKICRSTIFVDVKGAFYMSIIRSLFFIPGSSGATLYY